MDFTFNTYSCILKAFIESDYRLITIGQFIKNSHNKVLILRHDVDRFPKQALKMAEMEAKNGIISTYYFRIITSVYKPEIIRGISSFGHEIGYHYEDLTLCRGDVKKSIEHFERNLEKLRLLYPVKTICMHGSPLSKWDNKTIWEYYDYRKFGILTDTSFDVDYNKVFYISDNGRAWNRASVSFRDKVSTTFNITIYNTTHFIELINSGKLPDKVMINAHPDTFFDYGLRWYLNFGFIETKNIAKWAILKLKFIK